MKSDKSFPDRLGKELVKDPSKILLRYESVGDDPSSTLYWIG